MTIAEYFKARGVEWPPDAPRVPQQVCDSKVGISIRFVRKFDADREREDALARDREAHKELFMDWIRWEMSQGRRDRDENGY